MSFWQKITIGTKFLFGGWESALDYLLNIINELLAKPNIRESTGKIVSAMKWSLDWLAKIERFVPPVWINEFEAIESVVSEVYSVALDHEISAAEIESLKTAFTRAVARWNED